MKGLLCKPSLCVCTIIIFFFIFREEGKAIPKELLDTTIHINAVSGLKYDHPRFWLKPGSQVTLIFTNKDDMAHNLVITRPGKRKAVVKEVDDLGIKGVEFDFVPESSNILGASRLLKLNESDTVFFTVPNESGIYPYVCTYPAHGQIMYGAFYAGSIEMPELDQDPNVPHMNEPTEEVDEKEPPYYYRIFLPSTGPASMAVRLPHQLSYVWDAGKCYLRYAWEGGFLDNAYIWEGHHDAKAKILGNTFYTNHVTYPLRLDRKENVPKVKFKGYKLIDGYPQFHYSINEVEVFELIKAKEDGTGLIRTFNIPASGHPVWFVYSEEEGVIYDFSTGEKMANAVKIEPGEATEFRVVMTKTE